jgi:hypothetical protein
MPLDILSTAAQVRIPSPITLLPCSPRLLGKTEYELGAFLVVVWCAVVGVFGGAVVPLRLIRESRLGVVAVWGRLADSTVEEEYEWIIGGLDFVGELKPPLANDLNTSMLFLAFECESRGTGVLPDWP